MRLGLQRVGSAGGGSGSHGRRIVSISTSLTLTVEGFPEGIPRTSGLFQAIKVPESAQHQDCQRTAITRVRDSRCPYSWTLQAPASFGHG